MKPANLHPHEAERLAALRSYGILDTLPEREYDDITRLASVICDAPVSLISLLDRDRQWFKSAVGLDACETPRNLAFCAHAILNSDDVLVVQDALKDVRFSDNPLVIGDPNIRFYAGVPLVVPGDHTLGTLCVIDRKVRDLSDAQKEALRILAKQVVTLLEYRKAMKMLRVGEERFMMAWNGVGFGMWDWDISTGSVTFSDRFKELIGYAPNELKDDFDEWVNRIHPEDKEATLDLLSKHVEDRTIRYDVDYRLITKQGEWRWFNAKGQAVRDENGKATRMAGSLADITLRKANEERLQELAVVAEEATKVKSRFLANMSHELRTPLSGVLSTAELLADTELGPKQAKYVNIIIQSGDLLRNLLNDILDYSKIEAGALKLIPQVFTLQTEIQALEHLFEAQALSKGLALHFISEVGPADCLYMDKFRLFQIMANLIGNAIKYTETGSVTVRVSCPEEGGQKSMLFSVTDTGAGIPESYCKIIFDRFVQVDTTASRKGTGLGLAICASLADMMRGDIGVESELGKGSRFWFNVPLVPALPEQVAEFGKTTEKNDLLKRHEGCKVLLVEDVAVNRWIIDEMLKNMGCQVVEASNGQIAVDLVRDNKYDLVLMDCSMPVMDGYEATRVIRATGNQVPIIAVTAHAMADELDKCIRVGMNDQATKPLRKIDLQRIMDRWHPVENSSQKVLVQASVKPSPKSLDFDDTIVRDLLQSRPDRARRLVELTKNDVARLREDLFKAIVNGDAAEIGEHAHALKSVAAQIGGVAFSAVCRDLELVGKSGDISKIDDLTSRYCEQDALFHHNLERVLPSPNSTKEVRV